MTENEKQENLAPQPEAKKTTPSKVEDQSIKKLTDEIQRLKDSTVTKEEYAKVVAEKNELVDSVINGSRLNLKSEEKEKPADLKELAKSLMEDGIGNLEYAERALKYRDAYMKKTGKDPFAPNNDRMTSEDSARAAAVADTLKECVAQANGSESVFTGLLADRIKSDSPQLTALLKKKGL